MVKQLLFHSWKRLTLATITGGLAGATGAGLMMVINEALTGAGKFAYLALVFFALCVLHVITKTWATITLMRLAQSAIFYLRVTLSRKLLHAPMKDLHEIGKHGLLAILTRDIETLVSVSHIAPAVVTNGIVVIACMGYLAWLSMTIFLVLALALLVGVGGYQLAERVPRHQLERVRAHIDTLYQHFRNLVEGSKELKLNAKRSSMFVEHVIAQSAKDYQHSFLSAMQRYAWVENVGDVLFYMAIGVLLFLLPVWFPQEKTTLTAAAFTVLYVASPISILINQVPQLREVAIAARRIRKLDGTLNAAEPALCQQDPFATDGPTSLELRRVCHGYSPNGDDESRFVVGPVSVKAQQGQILFIVGGNGSGKTTLAMIMLGLYESDAGSVWLNGVAVNRENLQSYRQYFSAVFADFHVFEHLVGADDADLSGRAARYVDKLGMGHKVKIRDGKFSTLDLSTGQRKRLALVSSYLEDRPIYLFDEWAADQDPEFKRVFYTELLPELKARGKLVIVITHDDAYFACADRVLKLQDGRLIAERAPDAQEVPA
jgi:putative ATP-binding cassette transporter